VSLRILHVDHATVLGGAERSVLELAAAQQARGHVVTVAAGGHGAFARAAAERGIDVVSLRLPVHYVSAPARTGLRGGVRAAVDLILASRRISSAIETFRPDVVQVHTRKAQLATLPILRRPRPIVLHLRDPLPRQRILRLPVVLAVRRAAHAVALTPWVRLEYERAGALPRSTAIGVVPSGVDQRRLAQLSTPWLDGAAPPRIGFVGQIASWKGPHLLVELAEHFAGQSGLSFHLVGDVLFPGAEREYGEWLRQRIDSSSARASITWHGAAASPEEAMDRIDVLVHTSITPEPFGRVLVEAMASHRPIVALRRGSTTSLLSEDAVAFADTDRIEDLAARVDRLVADRTVAREMAHRAAEAAHEYEPARVAERMDAEYARVLA
jgi:glycosyltransferase involved in cell wall biosynthesis